MVSSEDSIGFAQLWPINITVMGIGKLEPTEDITPREALLLQMMLICATGNIRGNFDFIGYIKENKLEKHFKEV